MNQSNKALRDLVAEVLSKNIMAYKSGDKLFFSLEPTATQILALVTNHIKELPSMQSEWEEDIRGQKRPVSKARNELRHQLLRELEL